MTDISNGYKEVGETCITISKRIEEILKLYLTNRRGNDFGLRTKEHLDTIYS